MNSKLLSSKSKDKKSATNHISVFDLDQTLFVDNSSYRFGLYLYKQKKISLFSLIFIFACNVRYQLGLLSIPNLHQAAFRKLFFGRYYPSIKKHVDEFLDDHFDRLIYQPAFQRLKQAKEEGHLTVILSSSPDFLVGPISERFGVDHWESSLYAVDKNQCFDHISQLMLGENKADYVSQLIELHGLAKNNVTAYSDSYQDLPFLLSAGNPVAVNPDKKLRLISIQNNWTIL